MSRGQKDTDITKGIIIGKTHDVETNTDARIVFKSTDVTKDNDVLKDSDITKDMDVPKDTDITKDMDVPKDTDISKETDVTKEADVTVTVKLLSSSVV